MFRRSWVARLCTTLLSSAITTHVRSSCTISCRVFRRSFQLPEIQRQLKLIPSARQEADKLAAPDLRRLVF